VSEFFRDHTTIGVGGPIGHYHPVTTAKKLHAVAREVFATGDPWMVLGGGSNLVVSDDGFPGHVIHIGTRGRKVEHSGEQVLLTVQAGDDWDDLAAFTVSQGFQGLESLSGIPGRVGASVIQNIGAYGYEVASVIDHVELIDYPSGETRVVERDELHLGHRTSALKTGDLQGIVSSVTFSLRQSDTSLPIAYAQVAEALDLELGQTVPLGMLRKTVLALRSSKGMVLDSADVDSRSCGSFFINPVVSEKFSYSLPQDAPRWVQREKAPIVVALVGDEVPGDRDFADSESAGAEVKLSAAWLIEHSGISKGFSLPGSSARISTKHTLAITNPGGGTAEDVASLARYVRTHVANTFGVVLQPEPVMVGLDLG
jgi:UDP-N-acetylmuramate dehydrogenase